MREADANMPGVPPKLAAVLETLSTGIVSEVLCLLPAAPTVHALAKTKSPDEIARLFAVSGFAVRVLIENTKGSA